MGKKREVEEAATYLVGVKAQNMRNDLYKQTIKRLVPASTSNHIQTKEPDAVLPNKLSTLFKYRTK